MQDLPEVQRPECRIPTAFRLSGGFGQFRGLGVSDVQINGAFVAFVSASGIGESLVSMREFPKIGVPYFGVLYSKCWSLSFQHDPCARMTSKAFFAQR